jgi:hypothetical protein
MRVTELIFSPVEVEEMRNIFDNSIRDWYEEMEIDPYISRDDSELNQYVSTCLTSKGIDFDLYVFKQIVQLIHSDSILL